MSYAKSDLIDQEYARENFRKEPHCFKLPVEGFYLHENISGIGHGTWTVFFVEADGDETDICRVITVGELNNVLRLLKANLAAAIGMKGRGQGMQRIGQLRIINPYMSDELRLAIENPITIDDGGAHVQFFVRRRIRRGVTDD